MGDLYTNDEIVAMVLTTCFEGLEERYSPAQGQ
jgi:hypothetical protein